MYKDSRLKIDYNPVVNKKAFQLRDVGNQAPEDIEEKSDLTDDNSIFVSQAGDDTTGDGSQASPYKTIAKGISETTVLRKYVAVDDSNLYNEEFTSIGDDFAGLFATTGNTPQLQRRTLGFTPSDSDSIFVAVSGDDTTGSGTEASPYKTIGFAATQCDATHKRVIVNESGEYLEDGFEFVGNFQGLYGNNGVNATVKFSNTALYRDFSENYNIGRIDGIGLPSSTRIRDIIENDGKTLFTFADGTISPTFSGLKIIDEDLKIIRGIDYTHTSASGVAVNSIGEIMVVDHSSGSVNYTIYNSDYTVKASSAISGATGNNSKCAAVGSNFFVYWIGRPSTYNQYIAKIDNSGFQQGATITITTASVTSLGNVVTLSNGNIVVVFGEVSGNSNYYISYDTNLSVVISKTKCSTNSYGGFSTFAVAKEGKFYVMSKGVTGTGADYCDLAVYQNDGTVVTSPVTVISSGGVGVRTAVNDFGEFVIFRYTGATVIDFYSESGSLVSSNNILGGDVNSVVNIFSLKENNKCIINNYVTASESRVSEFYLYSASPIEASIDFNVFGLSFDNENRYLSRWQIYSNNSKPNIKYCSFLNCDNGGVSVYPGTFLRSNSDLFFSNNTGVTSGSCVYSVADSVDMRECVFSHFFADYALYNDGAASSSGDISFDHNTFFNGYGGIKLENNNGNEEIKNSIFHDIDVFSVSTDTSISLERSVNTGALDNVTIDNVIQANPLFVNEGFLDIDELDLRIKTRATGFLFDSPAYLLGDDGFDAGAYIVAIRGDVETWTSFYLHKPLALLRQLELVGRSSNQKKDGSFDSAKTGVSQVIEIPFEAVWNEELEDIEKLIFSDSTMVRIYLDPDSDPNIYELHTFDFPETIGKSAAHYRLTETGVQNVELRFVRKYEK